YLDQDRYEHTLGVMYTSASLAMCYGEDVNDAMIAGLLHDCAKCIPPKKKIRLCKKYHIHITESEYANPSLLHAKLGAYIAAEKYHIKDQMILSAIHCHTTGKPHMTMPDKILFISDYIEPGRKDAPHLPELRKLAFQDIDECLYLILKDTLSYLQTRNLTLDPMTEKTYRYYQQELKKEEQ
ncbi:bis(5'-nucleosyl)-tetraphosphatase (symmetrical) YqeK, partial [Sellimonas intestinalis]